MVVVWGKPIMAEVEQIVRAVKAELAGTGLMRDIRDTGADIMVTCTEHKHGMERNPSMGISKEDKFDQFKRKEIPGGTVHCFTCGYTADLPTWIARVLGLATPAHGLMWLFKRYAYAVDGERAEIRLNLDRAHRQFTYISNTEVAEYATMLDNYPEAQEYLAGRGMTKELINKYELGYDPSTRAITLPVREPKGRCLFIKRRGIHGRVFLNEEDVPKTVTLFGITQLIDHINALKLMGVDTSRQTVWLAEGEFNALTLVRRGKLALAMMGSELSEEQAKVLMRTGVSRYVAATDNDEAGRKGTRIVKDRLIPMGARVYNVRYQCPSGVDWNDMTDEQFEQIELF